jgi:DNA-binding IclR family transcriptional regulator
MLQYRGFVRQSDRTKAYGPGTALTGVAFAILQRHNFREVIRPHLEALNAKLLETVHLGLLDGTVVRFVDAVESPQAVRVASRLGRSMPANCTSTGKAMLAQMSTDELHRLYPTEELTGLTGKSIQSREALERNLATIRRRGYATSNEESEAGVSSVAVAFAARRAPARLAINVSVPTSRMSTSVQREIAQTLQAMVREAEPLLHG